MYDKCYQSRKHYDVTNLLCYLSPCRRMCCESTSYAPPLTLYSFNNYTRDGETSKVDNFMAYEIACAAVETCIAGSRSVQCGSCFGFMAVHVSNWHVAM
jgi:hypothetical protein